MASAAVVGINWGDEGTGRMVDLLTKDYDVVVRYQGGGNAGHTIVNEFGTFALHLIPSGVFRPGVMNLLGNGVALDPENLLVEMNALREKGVTISPENLRVSERASLLLPWHRDLDALEEARLKDRKYGSTKQGIAPFYSDKYQKKTLMIGEILHEDVFFRHLMEIAEWKNLTLAGVYGAAPYTEEMLRKWAESKVFPLKPYLADTGELLRSLDQAGKNILFEAQLGALRDLDFGIYPYTTSSNTLASAAPVGSGFTTAKIDRVVGVVKAYSTAVGEGPFVSELFGAEADHLREAGHEYGAKTGRPRRVGALDLVATRYGTKLQGATELAVTKLDVLSDLPEIPVCVRYRIDGEETDRFPMTEDLYRAEPVIRKLPGWQSDISGVRRFSDLPKEARDYILFLEEQAGCRVSIVSVGPERQSYIAR